ncbi:hypothetical protein J6590_092840 [Homalodisca vitripennis]|nr:hypothetical protein J6590_092840 [Homalodisca vitripennis]
MNPISALVSILRQCACADSDSLMIVARRHKLGSLVDHLGISSDLKVAERYWRYLSNLVASNQIAGRRATVSTILLRRRLSLITSDEHDSRFQESSLRQRHVPDAAIKKKMNWS